MTGILIGTSILMGVLLGGAIVLLIIFADAMPTRFK